MLGLRPDATGIYGLAPFFRQVPEFKDYSTLAQHLAGNGYHTAMAGKIFHGNTGRDQTEWGELGPRAKAAPFPPDRLANAPSKHKLVDWGTFPHRDEDKGDYQIASWTIDFLKKHAAKKSAQPFFCASGFFLPHVPCYTTRKWFDLHPLDTLQLPKIQPDDRADTPRFSWNLHWALPEPRLKYLREDREWKNITRSYLACTSFVDAQIGRVMKALEETGLAENTIVVVWSDHGFHLGEKEITGKNTLWDDGTRVPLIFAGPGIKSAQRVGEPAELLDLYPTFCELLNLPRPRHQLQGLSLVPQLNNPAAKRTQPAITTHGPGNHGVRTKDWRYIRYADGSEELYHYPSDPNEWRNLLYQTVEEPHRRKADELAKHLPSDNRHPAPGSKHRILTYDPGSKIATWEGTPINPNAPIPEIED